MRLILFCLCSLLYFSSSNTFGQQRNVINGNFSNLTFTRFVSMVEAQTDYHFYYDPLYTDSLTVNVTVENKTVNRVLDEVFAGTKFHYAIDQYNHIFVTHVREILTRLPADFLGKDSASSKEPSKFDYSAYEKRELKSKQAEDETYIVGVKSANLQGSATVSGIVRDIRSGEPIIGATLSSS